MTRRTHEQMEYSRFLECEVMAAGLRVRVKPDWEGFPVIPGKYGQVEYYGAEWRTGEERLRVYTDRRLIPSRLLAIPGVRVQQRGDDEVRMWFPAGDAECLRAVCRVIRARVSRKRGPTGVHGGSSDARA